MAKTVLSALLLGGALALANTVPAHASPRFGVQEVVLYSTTAYNANTGTPNPFDFSLVAQVTSPSGRRYTANGFFDGDGAGGPIGKVFKVRVYTDEIGTWKWTTTSNAPGLNARSGSFYVSGTLAGFFGKGPIVENPYRPRTFMQQYGEPVFLTAKFLDVAAPSPIKYSHTLFSEKLTDANRQAMFTRHLGMKLNKINVYLANRGDYASMSITPWVGTATANDKKRFNLARWRMFDQWTVKMRDAGVAAQFWFFADDSGFGDLPDADRQRLIKYAMARLSAQPNALFTLVLEWQEGWTTTEVHNHGNFLQQNNPWARLVTVHGIQGNFSFPTAAWVDFMDIQAGNAVNHQTVHSNTLANRPLAAKPLIQEEHGMGEENLANRQKAWAAFTGGAAGVGTGAFLAHLAKFAGLVDFERMDPADSLVLSKNAYGLAEKGRAYVFYLYSGGTVNVDLASGTGTFVAQWYNPRDGSFRIAPATTGGGARSFIAPSAEDWVLYIHK
jgi:hypothetical protein